MEVYGRIYMMKHVNVIVVLISNNNDNENGGNDYYEGSGGRAVERRTVNRGDGGSIPPTAVSKLRQFRSLHVCLCLSVETLKALLSGVYARRSKRSHTVCKCVTSSGLTNSREGQLLR